jgi:hypothetical protein
MVPQDIGAYISSELALIPATITAGAGNDGVEVNGPACNLLGLATHPQSVQLIIGYRAVLASSETLTITANLQDDTASAFNGTPADLSPAYAATVVETGAGTIYNTEHLDVPLTMARQYIRAQVTAYLSASGTDTVAICGIFVFGGVDTYPA